MDLNFEPLRGPEELTCQALSFHSLTCDRPIDARVEFFIKGAYGSIGVCAAHIAYLQKSFVTPGGVKFDGYGGAWALWMGDHWVLDPEAYSEVIAGARVDPSIYELSIPALIEAELWTRAKCQVLDGAPLPDCEHGCRDVAQAWAQLEQPGSLHGDGYMAPGREGRWWENTELGRRHPYMQISDADDKHTAIPTQRRIDELADIWRMREERLRREALGLPTPTPAWVGSYRKRRPVWWWHMVSVPANIEKRIRRRGQWRRTVAALDALQEGMQRRRSRGR